MAYVTAEPCIDTKNDASAEACPVHAWFAEDRLPSECARFAQINGDYHARR